MKKVSRILSILFVTPMILSSCSSLGSKPSSLEESIYDYNKQIVHIDSETGDEYYIALELDNVALVDEQSVKLKIVKLDKYTEKVLGYLPNDAGRYYFAIRQDNGVVSLK